MNQMIVETEDISYFIYVTTSVPWNWTIYYVLDTDDILLFLVVFMSNITANLPSIFYCWQYTISSLVHNITVQKIGTKVFGNHRHLFHLLRWSLRLWSHKRARNFVIYQERKWWTINYWPLPGHTVCYETTWSVCSVLWRHESSKPAHRIYIDISNGLQTHEIN